MKPLIYPEIKEGLYLISQDGQIYSNYKKDYLCPSKDKDGYLRLRLSTGTKLKKDLKIATLVLYNYKGPPPKDMIDPTVNHIDNDILNNYYQNLEWMERGLNSSNRQNIGIGEDNSQSKLNWKIVNKIRERYSKGDITQVQLSREYGVTKSCINKIIKNHTWRI